MSSMEDHCCKYPKGTVITTADFEGYLSVGGVNTMYCTSGLGHNMVYHGKAYCAQGCQTACRNNWGGGICKFWSYRGAPANRWQCWLYSDDGDGAVPTGHGEEYGGRKVGVDCVTKGTHPTTTSTKRKKNICLVSGPLCCRLPPLKVPLQMVCSSCAAHLLDGAAPSLTNSTVSASLALTLPAPALPALAHHTTWGGAAVPF